MTTPFNPQQGSIWMGNVAPFFPTAQPVTNYGAVGDGISDDTAAIQAVFDYFCGNTQPTSGGRNLKAPILFPPGTYKITGDLNLRSTIQPVVMGLGATIKASG